MRKLLKKMLVVSLSFGLVFILTSCDYGYCIYQEKDKPTKKVELINYDNPDARENPKTKYPLDLDKLEVIEELDSEKIESFLDGLAYSFVLNGRPIKVLCSHDGIGVRITYEDDSFDIITLTTIEDKPIFFKGEYSADGVLVWSEDLNFEGFDVSFRKVINDHFTTQI